ncbi:unnamed protein product [Trichobilharzia szidati]|nr:unnamed protein product [Trichobilharzia szidati]
MVDPAYKYLYVVFCCHGDRRKKWESRQREKSQSKCMECLSTFRIQLEFGQYKVVEPINTVHNHALTRELIMSVEPEIPKLSSKQQLQVLPSIERSEPRAQKVNMVDVEFGNHMTDDEYRHFHEIVYPRMCSMDTLISEIRETGSVWYKMDNQRNIEKFSFATKEMITLYKKFPEVVGMNSTYITNREGYLLYQLVITDGLNRSCTVMYSITHCDRLIDVEEVLQSFKHIMGDTSQTVTFVIDEISTGLCAIRSQFPACSIVLCAYSIIRTFNNKFPDAECRSKFKEMVYTRKRDRFYVLKVLMSTEHPAAISYINTNLWSCRHLWASCFNAHIVTLGNKTNNRFECCHGHLRKNLSNKPKPLELTIREIWECSIESSRRKAVEGNRNLRYFIKFDVDEGLSSILRRLTCYAAYSLYKSIKKHTDMQVTGSTEVTVVFKDGGRQFFVDKHDCKCSCFQNTNMLLPCRHLVYTFLHIYPRLDLFRHSTRWLRDYNYTVIESQPTANEDTDLENLIQGISYKVRNLGQTHPGKYRDMFLEIYSYLREVCMQPDKHSSTSPSDR